MPLRVIASSQPKGLSWRVNGRFGGTLNARDGGRDCNAASTPGLFDMCTGRARYHQSVFDLR